MPPALTIQGGQVMSSPPDVCQTPTPVGPIPTPYPNIALPATGMPPAKKVMIKGSPALTKASKIMPTNGDQAGAAGGVVSGMIMGKAVFIMASMKVKFEGNPATYQGNMTQHNKGNTIGQVALCAQTAVMING
jgi:uncharacterized Zn-binding protein involved in type VI secretion